MRGRSPLLPVVALLACAPAETPAPPETPEQAVVVEGIRYSAETQILESYPVRLNTIATVTNTTSQPRQITFPDGCVVLIRAYREPERTGPPAWDQSRGVICTLALIQPTLPPGGSEQYRATATAAQILGDSLPPGTYYLTALLRPDGQPIEVPAGQAELAL